MEASVADPDPHRDPLVRDIQRYESGSFYHQGKKIRKTLIPAVL
jgi:hypothetical protein